MPIFFFFLSSIYVLSITASSAAPELLRSGLFSSRFCLHCALWTEEQSVLSVHGVDYTKPDTDLVPALPDWQNKRAQIAHFGLPRLFRHSAHATPDTKPRSDVISYLCLTSSMPCKTEIWLTAKTETVIQIHTENMQNHSKKWDNAFYMAPLACNFPG